MRGSLRGLSPLFSALVLTSCLVACEQDPWVDTCSFGRGRILEDASIPHLGEPRTPVWLTFFGDFQCPGTRTFWYNLDIYLNRLNEDGGSDELSVFFRHYPLEEIHNRSRAASIAAAAAHRQGNQAFWRMFPRLLKTGEELSDEHIALYAESAGLDMMTFEEDLADPETEAVVVRDLALARELNLPGTPSVYLCGQPASPYPEDLFANINHLLEAQRLSSR